MTRTTLDTEHRGRRPECPVCGTWTCNVCGWERTYANRFSAEEQVCTNMYCAQRKKDGRFSRDGRMVAVAHTSSWKRREHQEEYERLISEGLMPRYPLRGADLPPRPDWDEYFLGIADAVSARGECVRARVGAVLVRDRRIISTGYNGVRAGERSCLDGACPRGASKVPRGTPYDPAGPGACIAFHAEDNALTDLVVRGGMAGPGDTMYTNKEPCERCAESLRLLAVRSVWRDPTNGRSGTIEVA